MEPHAALVQPAAIPARASWITRQGVQAGRYPEFAPAGKPQDSATQPDSDDWAEAMELAAEPLHPAMRQWAADGLPAPEVGFELTDGRAKCWQRLNSLGQRSA